MDTKTVTTGDVAKWTANYSSFEGWNNARQRRIQALEARTTLAWLTDVPFAHIRILEVGCGNGYYARQVIEGLIATHRSFEYHATDLIDACVEGTKAELAPFMDDERISVFQLDVCDTGTDTFKEAYTVVLSTGFAAAATYDGVRDKVAETLAPGGWLITDFVNHCAPYLVVRKPIRSVQKFLQYRNGRLWQFGRYGLAAEFKQYGLVLKKTKVLRFLRNPILAQFVKE